MPAHLCEEVDERTIASAFDATTVARGLAYARGGHVVRCIVREEGHALAALVSGSDIAPYRLSVNISHPRNMRGVVVDGECSCPVGFDCKHVVAALTVALQLRSQGSSSDYGRGADHDPRIGIWLSKVNRALEASAPAADSVLYLASVQAYSRSLQLTLVVAKRKLDGTFGKPRPYAAATAMMGQARTLTGDDVQAARLLHGADLAGAPFRAELFEAALRVALRTGRTFWKDSGHPLRLGPPQAAEMCWKPQPDGTQRLEATVKGELVETVCTDRVWRVERGRGEIAELTFAQEPRLAAALLSSPNINDAAAPSVIARLKPLGVPVPASAVVVDIIDEPPVPHLALEQGRLAKYSWGGPETPTAVARVTFAYGDARIATDALDSEWRASTASGISVRRRDRTAEAAVFVELERRGLRHITTYNDRSGTHHAVRPSPAFWSSFLLADVPALEAEGWKVTVAANFPHRVVASDTPWEITASGIDELSVDVALVVDGERVPLVPLLAQAIARGPIPISGERALVGPLPDGTIVAVPAARLQRLVDVLIDVFDRPELMRASVAVPLARALGLDSLTDEVRVDSAATKRIRELAHLLRAEGHRPAPLPRTLKATLRPYQCDGFSWLQRLRNAGFGGILADSMGLGKTVQTLSHLLAEKKRKRLVAPALVIAPTSLLPNWEAEARRFAPSLRTLVLHGARRSERHPEINAAHLVVTSYALLVRDADVLTARHWSVAILDEAQNIKNPTSKTAKAARLLQADQRLCLTGTPIENHLEELWSLFAFAEPTLLGERERFRRVFRTPIEKRGDEGRRAALASRVAPFLLRRTKERVARDLPAKSEILTRVELGEAQRDLYETIRAAMHARVLDAIAARGLARSRIVVLDALLKLRQVCCHPRLLPSERARGVDASAKLEALREMLEEMVDDGRRVLVFSQFTSMLRLIEQQLSELAIPYVQLTGETKDRATPVARFQAGEVPVFLISLKAGGTGLNLTAADTVVHYDPWWNPAVERQATDRAHRIGQAKPIFVYKLICENTIEERILEMQARKGAVADALLDEAASALPFSNDEIAALFE